MASKAEIRSDLVGRLFAVGVSVGFATAITRMNWVRTGEFPTTAELDQILILGGGLIASLLSWDRYLADMETALPTNFWRYAIDVCLVFIYMFLLITSNNPGFFLPILTIIFCLYVVRDLLIVRQPVQKDGLGAIKLWTVRNAYHSEASASDDLIRSPIGAVSWALYFGALTFLDRVSNSRYATIMVLFAIAGLILYRLDKSHRPAGEKAHGFRFATRMSMIVGLVVIALAIVHPPLRQEANTDLSPVQVGKLSHTP